MTEHPEMNRARLAAERATRENREREHRRFPTSARAAADAAAPATRAQTDAQTRHFRAEDDGAPTPSCRTAPPADRGPDGSRQAPRARRPRRSRTRTRSARAATSAAVSRGQARTRYGLADSALAPACVGAADMSSADSDARSSRGRHRIRSRGTHARASRAMSRSRGALECRGCKLRRALREAAQDANQWRCARRAGPQGGFAARGACNVTPHLRGQT
jgi:hypothetical protein